MKILHQNTFFCSGTVISQHLSIRHIRFVESHDGNVANLIFRVRHIHSASIRTRLAERFEFQRNIHLVVADSGICRVGDVILCEIKISVSTQKARHIIAFRIQFIAVEKHSRLQFRLIESICLNNLLDRGISTIIEINILNSERHPLVDMISHNSIFFLELHVGRCFCIHKALGSVIFFQLTLRLYTHHRVVNHRRLTHLTKSTSQTSDPAAALNRIFSGKTIKTKVSPKKTEDFQIRLLTDIRLRIVLLQLRILYIQLHVVEQKISVRHILHGRAGGK